jgi:UDP-glucose 4-epimerase
MMGKAFITGITGFVGQPLSQLLVRSGWEVSGLARNPAQVGNCHVLTGDVLNVGSYEREAKQADLLIHLAAPTVPSYIAKHPLETISVNVGGILNLLNLMESGAARHLIFVSTGKVYGCPERLPYREDDRLNPVGALGKAKVQSEELVRLFASFTDKRFSILRLFNGYGPGQNGDFLVPTIIKQVNAGKITLGDTASRRDFIFVDDIVAGIAAVVNGEAKMSSGFNMYNLASGVSYSPADLVNAIAEISGKRLEVESDPARLRQGEPDEERADISRLQSLGWRPAFGIKEGLERTWRAWAHAVDRPA